MENVQVRLHLGAVAASVVLAFSLSPTAAAACQPPEKTQLTVSFPQGDDAPVKLYESSKGGRLGSVIAAEIKNKLLLCSNKIGSVNEVRLPQGVAIQFQAGKAGTADGRYWVRSNQVRFESETAEAKVFRCERNQVKTRVAGAAAGAEACKK